MTSYMGIGKEHNTISGESYHDLGLLGGNLVKYFNTDEDFTLVNKMEVIVIWRMGKELEL